ncbi:hypothetical protein GYMLUDRAFT_215263 [Collybiopsis luxurians FD-317 M1]|nr:hypothetical protein GYMLUDRAFT_215263 [Collybiopsis luxurians FD-317 M1]
MSRSPLRSFTFNSVIVENTSSVARDHLASERTLLAYVRTSLGITMAGVGEPRSSNLHPLLPPLFRLDTSVSPPSSTARVLVRNVGIAATVLGILVLIVAIRRYFTVQSELMEGRFPIARGAIAAILFMTGAFITAVFAVVLAIA